MINMVNIYTYLNELSGEIFDNSIAIKTLKLIVAPESKTVEQARELVERVRQQGDQLQQEKFVQLVETILVYKLSYFLYTLEQPVNNHKK